MDLTDHWDRIYRAKRWTEVSWYQPDPKLSFGLISEVTPSTSARIVDVGGGASLLVDRLVGAGYENVKVLDVSAEALAIARRRLGEGARHVRWLTSSVLDTVFEDPYDVWHDRAVFHFLTVVEDRRRYVEQVRRSLRPGGYVVVATFSDQGPTKCSGLDVVGYSAESLWQEFGEGFDLVLSHDEIHTTPGGSVQAFVYCLFRVADGEGRAHWP